MRIAYVTETYPPEVNGVALTARRTEQFLRRSGHDVELIRPRQAHERRHDDADSWLTPGMAIPMYPDLRFGFPVTARLCRRWAKWRPQLVHVATEGPLGWSAVRAARRLDIPVTSDFRTKFHCYGRYYRLGWMEKSVASYLRNFHNRTRTTFVPTEELRDELAAQEFRNIEVIGRGVDARLFNPLRRSDPLRHTWQADGDAPVLLYVGRLAREKNIELAFDAMREVRKRMPGAVFVVAGDGPLRPALQRRYPEAIFTGVRHGNDLAEIYASADILLFPSRTDTFGNVVLEGMASGLLVVAFDTGAARRHLHADGRIAAPRDEREFVELACRYAAGLPSCRELRRQIRAQAQSADWGEILNRFNRHLQAAAVRMERTDGSSWLAA